MIRNGIDARMNNQYAPCGNLVRQARNRIRSMAIKKSMIVTFNASLLRKKIKTPEDERKNTENVLFNRDYKEEGSPRWYR
jgi:hypothetical protein